MDIKLRKFYLLVIALQATLIGFLIYTKLSRPPEMSISSTEEAIEESNAPSAEIRMLGDFGVGSVKNARYTRLKADKTIEREFGFAKLLHSRDDEWEIEKPYMNIYGDTFTCYITADAGEIQVETVLGNPTPKDATLTGNVVIHLVPKGSSGLKESFVYLDDIIFISDSSRFTTAGTVKFISEDIHLLGKGLDLIYNYQLERLEHFRIVQLDSLRIRSTQKAMFTAEKQLFGEHSKKENEEITSGISKDDSKRPVDYYKCVFNKNVVIDSPQQVVFADHIAINNIISEREPNINQGVVGADSGTEQFTGMASFVYVFVTCDDGLLVTPMDSSRTKELTQTISAESALEKLPKSLNDNNRKSLLAAKNIQYDASTRSIIADGPTELVFYTDRVDTENNTYSSSAVKITAMEKTIFDPVLNRTVFMGDCKCTFMANKAEGQNIYTLSSPKLTVDMSLEKSDEVWASSDKIEKLTAEDGAVVTITSHNSDQALAKFMADTVQYNASTQKIVTYGPSQLDFVTGSLTQHTDRKNTVPVKITSDKTVELLLSTNQAIFEGNCICNIEEADRNITLSSSRLIVGLSATHDKSSAGSLGQVEHISAQGSATVTVTEAASTKRSTVFAAQTIDYSASDNHIVADGPSVLTLYEETGITGSRAVSLESPLKITAKRRTRFWPAMNKAVFEGDCVCSAERADRLYKLAAPVLTIILSEKQNETPRFGRGVEYLLASGGVKIEVTEAAKLENQIVFNTPQLEYKASSDEIFATGLSRLNFYANDLAALQNDRVPVEITANEMTRFTLADNRIVFLGDTRCVMNASESEINKKYVLTAPQLRVDLASPDNTFFGTSTADIRHLTADGGIVQLTAARSRAKQRLGFVKLKGFSFEYDALERIFHAAGPGILIMDNTTADSANRLTKYDSQQLLSLASPDKINQPEPRESPGQDSGTFSLKKQCYAFIQNFDALNYYFQTNRVVAVAKKTSVLVSYVPVIKGRYGDKVELTCDKVAADLAKTPRGDTELLRLLATGSVTYADADNQFVGGKMFYSGERSFIKADADEVQSCLLNGTLVDAIEYDLSSGKINAKIKGPGALLVKR
ncbi:MAG: hypothetical protein ACYTBP_00670 [Planctomycetota bacterium]|jgi:hypothetical protein